MSAIGPNQFEYVQNLLPSQLSEHALRTTHGPSADDWERLQPILRRLYIDEDRNLKDIMKIMLNEYGHKATIKMYKSRLIKFGIQKHNRASDMAFVIRKTRQRDAQGKRSTFLVRNKNLSTKEVSRYIQRKRYQDPNFTEAPVDVSTPPHILCFSTPPSPSPECAESNLMIQEEEQTVLSNTNSVVGQQRKRKRSMSRAVESRSDLAFQRTYPGVRGRTRSPSVPATITVPEIFLKYELLFTSVSDYVRGSIQNGTWLVSRSGQLQATKQTVDPTHFQNLFCKAIKAFNESLFVQGRLLASKAFSLLPTILRDEHPRTLEVFFDAILLSRLFGYSDVCSMLQDYLGNMASIVLPEGHIWRQICILISLRDPALEESISRSWHCFTDSLSQSIGRLSSASVTCKADSMSQVYLKDPPRGELLLRQLLADYTEATGEFDEAGFNVLECVVYFLLLQQKHAEAETLLEDSMLSARRSGSLSMYQEAIFREMLAVAQYTQGKFVEAEENMQVSATMYSKTDGADHANAYYVWSRLEPWLREWGRENEAEELRDKLDELIVRITSGSTEDQ